MTSLDAPLPEHWTVRRARDAYLAENGFTVDAYDDWWTEGTFLGLRVFLPNTRHHRWSIMLHDLHHVVTGYGTDLRGEAEISAWEIRHSARALGLYVGSIVVMGVVLYGPLAPGRIRAAFRAAQTTRSLHALLADVPKEARAAAYAELLDLTVAELRERLGVARSGIAGARSLHSRAPTSAGDDGYVPALAPRATSRTT